MYNIIPRKGEFTMKVNEIYQDYLDYLKLKNKVTTINHTQLKIKNYVLPYFGEMDIYSITEKDYIDFQLKIKELNYSESFNEQIHTITKKFFDYISLIYKIDNVAERVGKIINTKKNQSKIIHNVWSKKEFKRFINKVDDPIYHAMFNFLFYTGARKSEAMALKVSDLQNDSIVISKSITKDWYEGKRLIISTKSGKSRKIKIDRLLKHELNQLIKYYIKKYDNYNSDFFLFGGNKPISPTSLERKKNHYCDLAKVKRIRIHDFRHSHATMLYNKNVKIKIIQERLGHADISTTMDTYVHLDENEQKRLIHKINLIRL